MLYEVITQGNWGGGIVNGVPDTGTPSNNTGIVIRNNRISANSGIFGAGGIAIFAGADNYLVEDNLIVGNFSRDSVV